jgi:hypothetical protein
MTGYNYKKPRSINLVSVSLLLLVLAAAYAGWKFVPPWWKGIKVDGVLSDAKNDASDLQLMSENQRWEYEQKIRHRVYNELRELGLEDTQGQPVEVGFGPNYTYIYARYDIIVHHPFGKTTRMKFKRQVDIPTTKHL